MRSVQPYVDPKIGTGAGTPTTSDLLFRELLSIVISECQLSREQIAAALTRKLGRRVSVSILNDYTARTKAGARFPAAYVSAFCEVTGDHRLARFLLSFDRQALLELGEKTLEVERAKAKAISEIAAAQKAAQIAPERGDNR